MATECLGAHIGDPQYANLGGDSGSMPQLKELRWNYGRPLLGSCLESLLGGNHLRYWKQASTGAFFLAVSDEMDLKHHHTIIEMEWLEVPNRCRIRFWAPEQLVR